MSPKELSQLADSSTTQSKPRGDLSGRFTNGKRLGDFAVPLGERAKPRGHVDPGSCSFRWTRMPIFYQDLAPTAGRFIEPIDPRNRKSVYSTGVMGQEVIAIHLTSRFAS